MYIYVCVYICIYIFNNLVKSLLPFFFCDPLNKINIANIPPQKRDSFNTNCLMAFLMEVSH